jgi:hypothetical protein
LAAGQKEATDGAASPGAAPATTISVDCATRIQVAGRSGPPGPRDMVIAGVTFSALKLRAREKPATFRTQRWVPVKAAFGVPATVEVATVAISPRDRPGARLMIGFEAPPHEVDADIVELRPCPGPAARRTGFLGGFRVRGPRCVKVRVDTPTTSATKRVAFGRGTCNRR